MILENENFIKSPLNYTGGKYKLLNQILPLFPNKIDTFVDLFAGGLNVSINLNANKIIVNDINTQIIELYKYFKSNSFLQIINEIDDLIKKYNLSQSFIYGFKLP